MAQPTQILAAICMLCCGTAIAEQSAGSGAVYSVVELSFSGPSQSADSAPARDVDFWVRFKHESGAPAYTVHGFWDGNGSGGANGNVFKVRFCPTQAGKWYLDEVHSNKPELLNEKEGDYVLASASSHPGFWEVDTASPGGRWFKRSDGSHPYIFGNTHYDFLTETNGGNIVGDIQGNAGYFRKLRFAVGADRYTHATDKPFLDHSGNPTNDGNFSHRPHPLWFRNRVDQAVQTAYAHDLIADLILAGPDQVQARTILKATQNGGDATPFLRYIAARYGSYPNVWICLANEWDIKTPSYTAAQVRDLGQTIHNFLPYPTPLSIHRNSGNWSTAVNTAPAWHRHTVLQGKRRDLSDGADHNSHNHGLGGGDKPVINDELSYEGAGDGHSEHDTIESHLGAFLGGGYASTGYKPLSKEGQYFWGNFSAAEHTAADNLLWLRQQIEADITFWKMAPVELGNSIFNGADSGFRAMAWNGNEYLLGSDLAHAGVTANLPAGTWKVTRFDAIAKSKTVLSANASGAYAFATPGSRAVLFHFKKTSGGPTPPASPSNLDANAPSSSRIDLAWTDHANNEDGFKVERSPNGTSGWTQIATLGANATTYSNTGLSASTAYFYRVRAYNAGSDSAYSNTASATTHSEGGGEPVTVEFAPEADTYVYETSPNTNFGTNAIMAVGGGTDRREIFIRFNVTGLPAGVAISDARVIVVTQNRSAASGGGGTIRTFAPNVPAWSETQPTWNSPLAGNDASGDLFTLTAEANGTAYAFENLTSAISGNGRVTFVIRSPHQDGAAYYTKEDGTVSRRPKLRITYTGGGTPNLAPEIESAPWASPNPVQLSHATSLLDEALPASASGREGPLSNGRYSP